MKTAPKELDVRILPAATRLPAILETFDSLPEGGSFFLHTDHDPRPLYERFRSRNPDAFGWIPVARESEEWTVEILRLKPKDDEAEVGACFARDHDEIDVLFAYLRSDLAGAAPHPALRALFEEFDSRLESHIRWEEEVLFPAVERKSPDLALGPGRVMREEHERIRDLKAAARRSLSVGDRVNARRALDRALEILLDHNLKEEAVYYPMSDEMFSEAEAAAILERIRSMK